MLIDVEESERDNDIDRVVPGVSGAGDMGSAIRAGSGPGLEGLPPAPPTGDEEVPPPPPMLPINE